MTDRRLVPVPFADRTVTHGRHLSGSAHALELHRQPLCLACAIFRKTFKFRTNKRPFPILPSNTTGKGTWLDS